MANASLTLANQIEALQKQWKRAKLALANEGLAVLRTLLKQYTLREIGRRTELSPTYLSQVKNGRQVISPDAFVKLAKIA